MTLNQVITELKKIANLHHQINSVFFGDTWNRLSESEIVYPACFMNMSDNYNYMKKEVEYKFSIVLLDRQVSENSNEFEVLNDMDMIAQDLITQIRAPKQKWISNDLVSIVPFVETEADLLAGVKFDLSITLPFYNNRCNIPSDYVK